MRKSLIKVIKTNWQQEATLGKATYCIVAFLAFWMCFEGIILESFNIHILGFYGMEHILDFANSLRHFQKVEIISCDLDRILCVVWSPYSKLRNSLLLLAKVV